MIPATRKSASKPAARPHIVKYLLNQSGKTQIYLVDQSRYPGAKVRELAKRLPRRQRAKQAAE